MRVLLSLVPVILSCGVLAESNVPNRTDRAREERAKVKREYGALFDQVSALLFADDPIGINFDSNTDEYDPEAGTILPRLSTCGSSSDVQRVVHEEFIRWFGAGTAGPAKRYAVVSEQIWSAWRAYQAHK